MITTHVKRILLGAPLFLLAACGAEPGEFDEIANHAIEPAVEVDDAVEVASSESAVIEGTEDWDWIGFHTLSNDPAYNRFPSSDVRNSVRAANGIAWIGNCTAFLIAPDIIMTADHCVRTGGVLPANFTRTATFFWETSTPRAFTCRGPLHSDPAADLVTLRCDPDSAGRLPNYYATPVRLSPSKPSHGADMFSVTYNCRCDDWSTGCTTIGVGGTKWRLAPGGSCTGSPAVPPRRYRLLSPGGLGQTSNSRFKNCRVNNSDASWSSGDGTNRRGFNTNCDILPGSSGGPVFNRFSGSVVGLHSLQVHSGGTYNQQGEVWNWMALADKNNNTILDANERDHKFRWTNWTSDGQAAALCAPGWGASGFECKGHYCDDVRILCQPIPNASGSMRWTSYFSEEQSGFRGCASNEVVSGVQCTGYYCDNVRFRCSRVSSPASVGSCSTSAVVSDETPALQTLSNSFIQSATCSGHYCDNMTFRSCAVNLPGGSCQGSCNLGSSTGSCYCDAICDTYGDCCSDVTLMCR